MDLNEADGTLPDVPDWDTHCSWLELEERKTGVLNATAIYIAWWGFTHQKPISLRECLFTWVDDVGGELLVKFTAAGQKYVATYIFGDISVEAALAA
jgi:hypothetical protein